MDYWDNAIYDYFQIDLKNYPNAMISQITLQTGEGEQVLPIGSPFGVEKIVFSNDTNSRIAKIYFGPYIPAWTQGKIYLSQFIAPEDVVMIAPIGEKMYYGYVKDDTINSVKAISENILNNAISAKTIVESPVKVLDKTSIGTVPAGGFVVALVPAKYSVFKDNGFGAQEQFAENNGKNGTGANGYAITLKGQKYYVYGEFKLTSSEVSIYVNYNE
jgi:hypothetical protein